MSLARSLLSFVVVAALLFAGRHALGVGEPPRVVELQLPAKASRAERGAAIDEALLVETAMRAGWLRADAVIRDRLIRNVRFALGASLDGGAGDDQAAFDAALALGMQRSDRVVRQRLRDHGERTLLARFAAREPSDDELREHLRRHGERFRRPPRARFEQLLLSAERRGATLARDAAALAETLRAGASPTALGDPSLLPRRVGLSDARRIDATFGADFGRQVLAAPPGRWSGPIRSSYGLHFVRVIEKQPATIPVLRDVRAELRQHWLGQLQRRRLRGALDELRADYRIVEVAP
jgi:hypothetical protein